MTKLLISISFLLRIDEDDILYVIAATGLILFGLVILRLLLRSLVPFFSSVLYLLFRLFSYPFFFLNGLQRHLSKPWRFIYKQHHGSDRLNKFMRFFWRMLKIPLYIILTPLRFVNAIFFNIFMHCSFEFFNYMSEIVDPTSKTEGGDNFFIWLLMSPVRIIKYLWHFALTVIESVLWVGIDTIFPALTLYHGTEEDASNSITGSPSRLKRNNLISGTWNVGSGNYAGSGIYFAPIRRTATHYARAHHGVLIICRVSLGKVLDLGMAPKYVFNQCGHPNATEVTRWGLKHGYTTGEWWRKDGKWWEYCMYDWQNRYNEIWRIRPIYIEELTNDSVHRISGGMVHWFFRKMVINDLWYTFFKKS